MSQALQRLCKWRTILTGWQLGTRSKDDPESQAVRDHREVTLLLRAEVNALTVLLIERQVFSQPDFEAQCDIEAEHLMRALEKRFPGARAIDDGMSIEPARAHAWMSRFPP